MAVQAASARCLWGRKMQKLVAEHFRSIEYDLRKGLSSSSGRGGPQLTRTESNAEQNPVDNCLRASSNVGEELCHDSLTQSFPFSNEMMIGSACEMGEMQTHVGTRHSKGHTVVQETNKLPRDSNGGKNTGPTESARELQRRMLQVGHGGGIIHLPSHSSTSGAITILKNRQQQGIIIDSYTFVEVLKRCLKQRDLTATRQLHMCITQSGMDKNSCVANTLLNVYIRCGRLQDARRVFDGLEKKTFVTWTMMIAGYAKNDSTENALEVFNRMLQKGAQPDKVTCLSILTACASPGALRCGIEIHSYIRYAGLDSDERVGIALVQMYAKCGCIKEARRIFDNLTSPDIITSTVMIVANAASGSIDDARLVFDRMEKRDLITWNIMIGAYAKSGFGVEAYRLFLEMKREGFQPDVITYLNILNASSSAGALEWVKEVHSHALKAGLESDLRVCNIFVNMYAKSGSIVDARRIFERLKTRDVVTWNTMIGAYAESGCGVEAYRLFLQMKREGFIPNAVTYMSILNAGASAGALEWVKEVHSHALQAGLESDIRVGNALVHMYAKSGSVVDARLVFERLERRDVVTWSTMIGAYAESGCGGEAYQLFLQMKREGFIPNAITFVSILNTPASAGTLKWVKEVHSHALETGLESDLRVGTALIHTYAKCGSIDYARRIFERMEKRDVTLWNTLIGAYAENGCGVEAYQLFLQMKREGLIPDAITYMNILNASAIAGALDWVNEVHSHALDAGLASDLRVGNALVHMYAKSGSIDDARLIFDRISKRDVVTWNTMIGGLAQHGFGQKALELFRKMKVDCLKPDGTTFVAVLSACVHAGLIEDGRTLFLAMTQKYAVEPTVVHYNCLVDLLGRAGRLEEAEVLIGNMPVEPDGVTWGALLGACRTYGNVELGERAAKELLKLEPKSASAYVLLSNIYAAAGKWEKVSLVRTMMQERGVRKEPGRSWIEVDNKIHEFVVGDKSHQEERAIYTELKKLTEKLKSEGYVPDTQLVLQNIDEEDKELALCSHSEKLAIIYGLMHIPRGKPIHVYKNLRVCSDCHTATKLISKVTGREIIARDANRFHHFRDGLCSCGDYW